MACRALRFEGRSPLRAIGETSRQATRRRPSIAGVRGQSGSNWRTLGSPASPLVPSTTCKRRKPSPRGQESDQIRRPTGIVGDSFRIGYSRVMSTNVSIEVDKHTADVLQTRAAELGVTVPQLIAELATLDGDPRDADADEIAELDRRYARATGGSRVSPRACGAMAAYVGHFPVPTVAGPIEIESAFAWLVYLAVARVASEGWSGRDGAVGARGMSGAGRRGLDVACDPLFAPSHRGQESESPASQQQE